MCLTLNTRSIAGLEILLIKADLKLHQREVAEVRSHLGVLSQLVAPSHPQNLFTENAKIAELETEATFLLEKQKAENQAKMLQIQGEVVRAKSRARVHEDYNPVEIISEIDELESNVYEEKV